MKLKKLATGVAVASATLAFSSASLALDCSYDPDAGVRRAHLVDEIVTLADMLRCTSDGGYWSTAPIWQYRGKGEYGCIVHAKLAKQLNEERTFEDGDKPPKNKQGTNDAAGAANDIENGKDEAAYIKLTSFIETILYDYANKLNGDNLDAATQAAEFAGEADDARACIAGL